jgi:hypothetical protein
MKSENPIGTTVVASITEATEQDEEGCRGIALKAQRRSKAMNEISGFGLAHLKLPMEKTGFFSCWLEWISSSWGSTWRWHMQ